MQENLTITKRQRKKGDDGHKIVSVRMKEETIAQLEQIAGATNRSRNELINLFIEYGIAHHEIAP